MIFLFQAKAWENHRDKHYVAIEFLVVRQQGVFIKYWQTYCEFCQNSAP